MNRDDIPTLRLHLSLVLLSASLIAFQLEQMQLLAYVQWHHFAYLVISVALLGFGASGTVIALYEVVFLRNIVWLLPSLMFGCSATMALALPITQNIIAEFDISLLFVEPGQAGLLLIGQFVYLLIFFLGAMPLGLVFIHYSSRVGSLYGANLFGSGAGGIVAVSLMYFLLPHELPGITALLPWCGGLLVTPRGRPSLALIAGLSLAVIGIVIVYSPESKPSQYKAISRTLDLPEAKVIASQPSPHGFVQQVNAPALRYAPGLSFTYDKEVEELHGAVFSNGDWFGELRSSEPSMLKASLFALPYALTGIKQALVLEAGTGSNVILALEKKVEVIVAVEPHRKAVEVLFSQENSMLSSHYQDSSVTLSHQYPRTWLALNDKQFDLITLPVVGSFGGTSGLFALQEQYLLTLEAFNEMWNRLSPEGVLHVSAWLDSPPRNSLRLATTIAETIEKAGVDIQSHVVAVRGWDMISFLVKRSPFTSADIAEIRSFCSDLQFDPLLLPEIDPNERQQYHFSTDQGFYNNFNNVFSSSLRKKLYNEYEFDIRPVNDNRPFFSQFIRRQSIGYLINLFGKHTTPFLELGYVLVLIGFVQMILAAAILILLPLLRLGLPGKKGLQRWTVPFFGGLGLGYMFYEIVLIHELVFFFGHPIFAAAAVISSLLVFSGLGSLFSNRFISNRPNHSKAAFVVALLLFLNLFILQPVLYQTIGQPMHLKIIVFLILVAPSAFVMGMPFPLGLARLAIISKSQAAWAWGINGSVSVVSTVLAAILAVELGFSAVMLTACFAYTLAALSGFNWTGTKYELKE